MLLSGGEVARLPYLCARTGCRRHIVIQSKRTGKEMLKVHIRKRWKMNKERGWRGLLSALLALLRHMTGVVVLELRGT